jgi:hypothetical protein
MGRVVGENVTIIWRNDDGWIVTAFGRVEMDLEQRGMYTATLEEVRVMGGKEVNQCRVEWNDTLGAWIALYWR